MNQPTLSDETEFLPASKAFPFSIQQRGNDWQVTWDIHPDYYLYRNSIAITSPSEQQALASPVFNQEAMIVYDANFDKDVAIFKHHLQARFSFQQALPKDALLTFQGCAEAGLCYPMQSHAIFPEPVNADESRTGSVPPINVDRANTFDSLFSYDAIDKLLHEASLVKISLIFLVLGIGLCLTPCVLPMMPIISSLVLGRKDLNSLQAFMISSTYVLTMSITYAIAGLAAASLGASANIQIWMQHPMVLSVFAAAFVILALPMYGLYELRLPQSLNQKLDELSRQQKGGSLLSAAILGVLSALVVSPCISAPLAGALVFITATGDLAVGGSALFFLGIGMGLPLIALCTFGTSFLPKSGDWLNYSKRIFALLLLAVAIWMLARFINPQLALFFWGALFVLAAFSFGSWSQADPLLRLILTILLLWGLVSIIGAALGNKNPLQPLENLSSPIDPEQNGLAFTTIGSYQELEQALLLHSRPDKIFLLDFYADWCTSCKEIEHRIFENPQFHPALTNMTLYRADLSDNTVENFDLLEQLNLFGPPAILFFDGQGQELKHLRIQGTISEQRFAQILDQLP